MLHNIRIICPLIETNVINSCSREARLFLSGAEEITSAEVTKQGDPTAMPIYALGSLPLLNILTTDNTKYSAYADDIICVGRLRNILTWWNKRNTFGPKIEYFPKPSKSCLIEKPEKYQISKRIFKDTNLNITNESKRHLGAVVDTEEFRKEHVIMKVNDRN